MECCIFPPNASLSLHDYTDFCIIGRVLYGDIASTMFATALTLGQTIQLPLEVLRSACYGLFELYQPHTLHVHSLSARGKRFQIEAGHQGAQSLMSSRLLTTATIAIALSTGFRLFVCAMAIAIALSTGFRLFVCAMAIAIALSTGFRLFVCAMVYDKIKRT
jgi:hypothetical protein